MPPTKTLIESLLEQVENKYPGLLDCAFVFNAQTASELVSCGLIQKPLLLGLPVYYVDDLASNFFGKVAPETIYEAGFDLQIPINLLGWPIICSPHCPNRWIGLAPADEIGHCIAEQKWDSIRSIQY